MGSGGQDLAVYLEATIQPTAYPYTISQAQTCASGSWHSSALALAVANGADMWFVFVLHKYKLGFSEQFLSISFVPKYNGTRRPKGICIVYINRFCQIVSKINVSLYAPTDTVIRVHFIPDFTTRFYQTKTFY